MKDGFAVAEVKLQPCKEDADNKHWLEKLKNGYHDDKSKTAELYLKVVATQNTSTVKSKGEFLKGSPFKMIGNNWHEPVDDPQIALWNSEGTEKPESNTFGMGRGRLHSGLDIFSLEGSDVYACLDAEVYEKKWHTGYGWTVTLKVDNPSELKNRKREYTHAYSTDLNSKSKFNENDPSVFLFYAHLQDIFVEKAEKIKAGKKIGLSGISGIQGGTYDPHVHFNIFSTHYVIGMDGGSDYLADPALYVYWKTEVELTENDKKIQEERMEKGKNSSNKNFKPKLSLQ